ncbi:MAG: single-stranded DNA-binding protein [Sphingobacteriaceae bacterium]|nr:single-stranded DNA-binding protein [Sphingobacteriaceae bacterium]
MSGINKVILIGRLGKDPIARYVESGVCVVNFTLATTENFTKDGKRTEQTEWHQIVMWRSVAELAVKYLKKGTLIYLEGKLRTRSFEDTSKIKRQVTEVVADSFKILGSNPNQTPNTAISPSNTTVDVEKIASNDESGDLPF